MYKYNVLQHYPGSGKSCHYVLTFDTKRAAKKWIKTNGNTLYTYTIQKIKQVKFNLIIVPHWLDFEPVRTRYIEAVKAYRQLCDR